MNNRFRVGFCVSGHGRLFRAAAVHRAQLGTEIALAVLDAGSDRSLDFFCEQNEIPSVRLRQGEKKQRLSEQVTRSCVDANLDLLCLTFNRILSPDLVRTYDGRIFNVHMALLPSFRGLSALNQAIEGNVRFAGATIHEVTEEVDRGPIIAQCVVGLRSGETPATLGARLFGLLRLMYLQVIVWYRDGRVFKDNEGHLWVRDGLYGQFPISPAVEEPFAD